LLATVSKPFKAWMNLKYQTADRAIDCRWRSSGYIHSGDNGDQNRAKQGVNIRLLDKGHSYVDVRHTTQLSSNVNPCLTFMFMACSVALEKKKINYQQILQLNR